MDLINRNFQLGSKNHRQTTQIKMAHGDSSWKHWGNFKNSQKSSLAEKFFDFLISFSISMIFLGLVFFSTGITFQGVVFDKQIGFFFWILLALIAWAAKSVAAGEMKIRRTPLDIPIAIFWLACFLSTIFSIDKFQSLWGFSGNPTHGLMNITASIVLYYIIMSNLSVSRLRFALGTFIFSGLLIITKEILEINKILDPQNISFFAGPRLVSYLTTDSVGSVPAVAIFISTLIIVLAAVFIKVKSSEIGKTKKFLLESFFLLMIVASLYLLLALYQFVPWIGISIGLGFFLIYIFSRSISIKKGLPWLPILVCVSILAIMLLGNAVVSNFKIVKTQLPAEIGLNHQLSWEIAKKALAENFFLGSGPATYGYNFSLHKPQDFNLNALYNLRFKEGSGILWEMLPTLGILGTLAYILLAISFLSVGLYLLSRKNNRNKIYSLGLMAAVIVIFVDSFFVRLDVSITILGILLAIFALGSALMENDAEERFLKFSLKASQKYALISALVFLAVSAGSIFLCVFLVKIYVADIFAGIAERQSNVSRETSIKIIEKAIALNSNEGKYYVFEGRQYMELANSEFLKGENADKNLFGKYLESAIVFTAKGKELMSKDIAAVEAFALVMENRSLYSSQFFQQTIDAYNEALALEPHNAVYFLKIGKMQAMQAALEKDENARKALIGKAKDWFQKAADEKNNLAEAQFQLGSMQQILEEKDDAILSLQKAIMLDNTNADYFLMLASAYQSRGADGDYENAENIYKNVISARGNDINIYLGLGLLYEKTKRFSEAAAQYETALKLLPDGKSEARNKIQKMIDNAKKGIENTAENIKEITEQN